MKSRKASTNNIVSPRRGVKRWLLVGLGVAIVAGLALFAIYYVTESDSQNAKPAAHVSDYASCKKEKSHVKGNDCTYDGNTYNKIAEQNGGKGYVGLSEEEAFSRAHDKGKMARVVERDGKSLMVTMDLRQGRLNFTINKGIVTAIEVEGAKEK